MSTKNNKLTLNQVSLIKEWLPFSDDEISIFQFYFFDYMKENEEKISKSNCYLLACLANETQYQMRLLKARINGDRNIDVKSNNKWIVSILSFDNLVDFILKKIVIEYEKSTLEKQYELSKKQYSYFTTSDETKQKIKDDLSLVFK